MIIRTGIGFDAHCFAPERRLVLGGALISRKGGLKGHSDADVLCHAVMDALLGAVAAGDIGMHFPDTDSKWKDADSLMMLGKVVELLKKAGATTVNVDATIMAQVPRLSPYMKQMQANIARRIGIDRDRVSIKATTTEGMGAIGRKEGIAAMAVATVMQSVKRSKFAPRRKRGRQ
jgi:2-C-methyl-D-erythritol 2,4-cyclodiphosphate synthase